MIKNTLNSRVYNLLWLVCCFSMTFLLSSCSTTEPISVDNDDDVTVTKTTEERTPFIAGFIEFIDVKADDDTVKTRLSNASLSIRDLAGLPLSSTRTNVRGEFFIELDAFRPSDQYDLFIYSSPNGITRNIRFIYTIEESNNIEILLDRSDRTVLNIDYLDLNTGEGRGGIISN